MAGELVRRDFVGGAVATTLNGSISAVDTTIVIAAATGWPTAANGPFAIVIDRGNVGEEKVLCSARSTVNLTVASSGRGHDSTSAASHATGVSVEVCVTAQDLDEANKTMFNTIGQIAAKGDILAATGANALDNVTAGANATMLMADSAQATGIKWVAPSGDVTINSSGVTAIGASKVTNAMMADNAIGAAEITNNSITAAKMDSTDFTSAGLALMNDLNAAAQIATLGLDADLATFAVPASTTISAYGKTLVDDADAATARATLGLDTDLGTFSVPASTTISAFGATLVDDAAASNALTTLGLDTDLATFAVPASTTISTFGKSLVDDADAATARATLGVQYSSGAGAPGGTPAAGDQYYDTTNNLLYVGNSATVWVCITPQAARVATSQTTASTSYADLATTGPTVTITTGTKALVTIGCSGANNGVDSWRVAFAISGATTVASSDNFSCGHSTPTSGYVMDASRQHIVTGLTAGSNVFKMQYRVTGATTGAFSDRSITVTGLP